MTPIYDILCMLCGRAVGQLHGRRLYRDNGPPSIRKDGKRTVCGYCGGSLYIQPDDSGMLRFRETAMATEQIRAS